MKNFTSKSVTRLKNWRDYSCFGIKSTKNMVLLFGGSNER